MGVDVSTLIPHKLPTGDLAKTAEAVAIALQARVKWGRLDVNSDLVWEGEVGEGEAFTLIQDTPDVRGSEDAVYIDLTRQAKRDDTETFNDCYIYRHCIECGTYSPHRWWSFERTVFDKEAQGYLSKYRRAIQREASVWGATEAIYFPDSYTEKADFLYSDKAWMPWSELLAKTKYLLEDELTDISRVMREGSPHPDLGGRTVEVFYEDFSYMPLAPDEVDWHRNEAAAAALVSRAIQKASAEAEELLNPLNPQERERWYSHLVAQSKTDHIYDLIHGFLDPTFCLNHKGDFVVLRRGDLPKALKPSLAEHRSIKIPPDDYCFRNGRDYVVLHDYKLTPYLEAARRMSIIEDWKGRRFIELHFTKPKDEDYITHQRIAEESGSLLVMDFAKETPEALYGKEGALAACWQAVSSGRDKELAVQYADGAMAYLSEQIEQIVHGNSELSDDAFEERIGQLVIGYNIPAAAYAWNNLQDKARDADARYMHSPYAVSGLMDAALHPYLEMLMAKGWTEYLAWVFSHAPFRNHFLPHYEAYVSLLIDAKFPMTRMGEVVPIINRVNNMPQLYR